MNDIDDFQKELELIKFTLTPSMYFELINYNKVKKELSEVKKLYNLNKNANLILKIETLQAEIEKSKMKFVREFRLNNQKEIEIYLKLKDKI